MDHCFGIEREEGFIWVGEHSGEGWRGYGYLRMASTLAFERGIERVLDGARE